MLSYIIFIGVFYYCLEMKGSQLDIDMYDQ